MELGNDDEDRVKKVQVELDWLDQIVKIGTCLSTETTKRLIGFFKDRIHYFT